MAQLYNVAKSCTLAMVCADIMSGLSPCYANYAAYQEVMIGDIQNSTIWL